MGLTLLWVWLGGSLVAVAGPFSFIQLIRKWVTVLAGVLLLRSRHILRPLPSGRASLAVSLLYHLILVISIDVITKYE